MQLAAGEGAHDGVLELAGQLLLDIALEAAEEERADDGVQPADEAFVHGPRAFDHVVEGVGEPVAELLARAEDVRHEEVHERPELHQVVLQGRAREEEAAVAVEVQQGLGAGEGRGVRGRDGGGAWVISTCCGVV